MNGAKIRRWILVAVTVLAAASMFPSLGGDSSKPRTSTSARPAVRAGYVHKLPASAATSQPQAPRTADRK